MDPYRSQPRNERERRNRRDRGEDRWSRRSDYERDPIDPFEGQGEQEEWEFTERERRGFGSEFAGGRNQRYERAGFDELEDWQKPRQFGPSWNENQRWNEGPREQRHPGRFSSGQRHGQSYGGQRYEPAYGRPSYGYGEGQSAGQAPWGTYESERFGTRQPFGSGRERSGGRFGRQDESAGMHSGKGPKGYRRSDERIQEEISDRLTADGQIDATEITISVRQGEVTLEGTVPERSMKRAAEDLAEEIIGVHEVNNRLRIERQQEGQGSSGRQAASHNGGSHASSQASSSPTRSGEKR